MTNKAMNTLKAIVESGELEPNRELGIGAAQHYLESKKVARGDIYNVAFWIALGAACVFSATLGHIALRWTLGVI